MRYIKLYENYSKRRMLPVEETSKIKKDLDDMFIELTDNGFRYELKSGVVGTSKLKDHKTETLYLVIVKPNPEKPLFGLFDTYYDDTLKLFRINEVIEYVLMFVDYMKDIWGEDIEVESENNNFPFHLPTDSDKMTSQYFVKMTTQYFVRIKKRL